VTDLLRYPVLAISPSGVDLYESERDLVTCHRRAVKATYEGLVLIDQDQDKVQVVRYRTHPLPPRRLENGRLNNDFIRVEVGLTDPERLEMETIRELVVEAIRSSEGEGFDENDPVVAQIKETKSMAQLQAVLQVEELEA
jgi:hypothetical protein